MESRTADQGLLNKVEELSPEEREELIRYLSGEGNGAYRSLLELPVLVPLLMEEDRLLQKLAER